MPRQSEFALTLLTLSPGAVPHLSAEEPESWSSRLYALCMVELNTPAAEDNMSARSCDAMV